MFAIIQKITTIKSLYYVRDYTQDSIIPYDIPSQYNNLSHLYTALSSFLTNRFHTEISAGQTRTAAVGPFS
jgi:hypothetical protein